MAALLAALLEKKGTGDDAIALRRRVELANDITKKQEDTRTEALLHGRCLIQSSISASYKTLGLQNWAPVLIIAPPSILDQWKSELAIWGHFSIAEYYKGPSCQENAIKRIMHGEAEIMLCPHSLFQIERHLSIFVDIPWKLLVVDEYHKFKNIKVKLTQNLRVFREKTCCGMIGLTGTLMQNNHEELWTLIDCIKPGLLGSWGMFEYHYAKVIKMGR